MANPDITSWLTELGLGDYGQVFTDNRIDFDVLGDLAEADLRELGLALGDRKRLLKAIEGLTAPSVAAVSPAPIAEPIPAPIPAPIPVPAPAAVAAPEGERRQVAVLFDDISGFTRLAAKRDAEDVHQMLNRFFAAVDTVVQDFGGSVDKHIGDAVMAVFGAPVAHTDDPERAVRAALGVHAAAAELDPPMQVHAGVASGQVVASSTGSAAHLEYTVTGETVNLASRLTDLATAGETLISGGVHSAIGDRLDGESLGEKSLKGLLEPVVVWRADGLAETPAFVGGQFIGRTAEVAQFQAALDATLRNGHGQTLFIRGEAGIGKTRLLHEFQRLAAERGFLSHGGQALDFGVGEGQDAVRVLLRGLLGLAPGAGHNLRTGAAERVTEAGLIEPEKRLHLNDLLNLPQAEEQRALYEAMDNEQRKRGRVETLVTLICNLSEQSPLLLRLEDLHWASPALLDYLTGLVTAAADHPVLLLLTSRLQADPLGPAWRGTIGAAPFQTMDLGPLTSDEARNLVFDFEGVDAARAAACIERSGGNPLFLEQLLRSPDSGDGQTIPGSVQSVVQSRIDGLSAADRAALQAASVLGQRFALDALRFIAGDAAYEPDNLLNFDLVRRSDDNYQFSHALFRDAVNGSFLKGRRRELHLRAADWYQDREVVLYAEHLGQAESDRAPAAFQQAARAEARAYRLEGALKLVERGLALVSGAAERFDLMAHRADLLRQLGRPEDGLKAWEEAVAVAATDRQRCLAWVGIAAANRLMGMGERALSVLDQAEAVAKAEDMEKELAEIYCHRGGHAFVAGKFEQCLELHHQALRHARGAGNHEWEAVALGGVADAEYGRGRMRNALDNFESCFALCRAHDLLHIEARNSFMPGVTGCYIGTQAAAIEKLKSAAELSDRIHNVRTAMMARMIMGETYVDMADFDAAEVPLREGLSIARSLGNRRIELYILYEQARNADGRGQRGQASEILEEAIAIGRDTGIHFHGPRLFALQARFAAETKACRTALSEGQGLVDEGANAHNVLWFHRDAMDACLAIGDADGIRRHADALIAFTAEEALPWADFFAARGHALANCIDGRGDADALAEAHAQGHELGLAIALPDIEAAQAELG